MTSYLKGDEPGRPTGTARWTRWLLPVAVLTLLLIYLSTLAQTLVLGDPTEYTFVASILGIAHPPGYAFITLLGKLFQTLVPLGEIPWRMHFLSAVVASTAALFAGGTVDSIAAATGRPESMLFGRLTTVFTVLVVGTTADHWQHAIHANPHIITATFLAANLFFLTRWWAGGEKWLLAFSFSAGLGVAHHPLTAFGFPAYTLFILWVRPSILREWRTLLKMLLLALLGLSVWLYFPIRSPMQPQFGPSTMNTLDGFLDHVLARGLSDSLPYYSPADLPNRLVVLWSLLRLQYALPTIFLALVGAGWLSARDRRPLLLLYGLALLLVGGFVISLKAQDIMAYMLGPFLVIGLLAGVGLWSFITNLRRRWPDDLKLAALLTAGMFLLGPLLQVTRSGPYISLREYSEGVGYVNNVFGTFAGSGQGAVLLNDWEHMTPLWYTRFVEDRWPDPADVRPEFVSAARTWLENVFDYLPGGPVYLSNFRRDVFDAGFRLRPSGPFYQVVEPGNSDIPAEMALVNAVGGDLEIVGYWLPETVVAAGNYVPLTLAMRAPEGTADFYVPVLRVGEIDYPFTTDSHLVTPEWQPGEVIVERFDFALPHDLPAGEYPIALDLKNLSSDEDLFLDLGLGELSVSSQNYPVQTDRLLANFRQRVGLVSASARSGLSRTAAPWQEPIAVQAGDSVNVTLRWRSLAPAEESYTVFVHLIDLANRPIVDDLDYTPLGGAAPTHLWIPKWLPGQQLTDPYRLQIPPGLAAGTYAIEVGLYEMVSQRRLHLSDGQGNLVGDRFILGHVTITE